MDKKRIIWLVVFLLIVFFGFKSFSSKGEKKAVEEQIIPVAITNPQYGQIKDTISLMGDIKGETEVLVRPKTPGRVEEIFVKEGDEVEEGDALLSFAAGLSSTDEVFEDMVTFAPIKGIIGVQYIKLGEQIVASMGTINPAFSIYQIDRVKILSDVSEKYSAYLKRGLDAQIKLEAFPDKIFAGKISSVRPVVDPMTRTIQIEILANNPERKIKPGMFCRVELVLREINKALLIPADAVLGDEGKYVYVVRSGRAQKRDITTGIKEQKQIETISGLAPSDQVIVVGQRVVQDGAKVEIKPND